MVTFASGGGLGNKIFQYVSARLLAEKLGYELMSECQFTHVLTPTTKNPGAVYNNDQLIEVESINTGDIFKKQWGKRNIHLQGFWQNANYYIPNRNQIVGFFNERSTTTPDKENIVMHVRLGDYKIFGPGGNVLHQRYYLDCLEKEIFNRLFIVTDSKSDSYFDAFSSFKPIIINRDEASDFWFLTEFDRIIIGNSTFSWWAAFLSNATKIYTPKCWIRNSNDIYHELYVINNGKCNGIQMNANFLEYN